MRGPAWHSCRARARAASSSSSSSFTYPTSLFSLPSVSDSDGDGIADPHDACPDVPSRNSRDSDGDGLPDACDACPNGMLGWTAKRTLYEPTIQPNGVHPPFLTPRFSPTSFGAYSALDLDNDGCWDHEEDPDFIECSDYFLSAFLDGLIIEKRGQREGAPPPEPPPYLTQNIILRKLKIAFSLQSQEIIQVLAKAGFRLSKHELSAFFRHPSHKHYRACQDQVLRKFLQGLTIN